MEREMKKIMNSADLCNRAPIITALGNSDNGSECTKHTLTAFSFFKQPGPAQPPQQSGPAQPPQQPAQPPQQLGPSQPPQLWVDRAR